MRQALYHAFQNRIYFVLLSKGASCLLTKCDRTEEPWGVLRRKGIHVYNVYSMLSRENIRDMS